MPATEQVIRPAERRDIGEILRLVAELADFEKEPDAARGTEAGFAAVMFPEPPEEPRVWGFVAEVDGAVVGMCVWFLNFSTWTGQHGIYVEDLYVSPGFRGRGIATALLAAVAGVAAERGYERVEWVCLDWNEPAMRLYGELGAESQPQWNLQRVSGDAIAALAGRRGGRR